MHELSWVSKVLLNLSDPSQKDVLGKKFLKLCLVASCTPLPLIQSDSVSSKYYTKHSTKSFSSPFEKVTTYLKVERRVNCKTSSIRSLNTQTIST